MISVSEAPLFRWSIATTCAVLLPSRAVPAAFFWPLGAFFPAVDFLAALSLEVATLGARAPPLAFFPAFAFAAAGSGCVASPKSRMRSQILVAATLLVLNRFTGATPGRQFQVATIRSGGHAAIRSASSLRLLNVSKGVGVAGAASSAGANALIAFSGSIVYFFIIVSPFAALFAVITWITPKCLKHK